MARVVDLGWWGFWLVCGAALVLGAVALPFLLPLPVLAAFVVLRDTGRRQALVAGPLGVASALLFIASLDRGPDGSDGDDRQNDRREGVRRLVVRGTTPLASVTYR